MLECPLRAGLSNNPMLSVKGEQRNAFLMPNSRIILQRGRGYADGVYRDRLYFAKAGCNLCLGQRKNCLRCVANVECLLNRGLGQDFATPDI